MKGSRCPKCNQSWDRCRCRELRRAIVVIALALMSATGCSRVTVQRAGSSAPWVCADEPARPAAQDGGFKAAGSLVTITPRDLAGVTDYVVDLQRAYRSCRAVVDQVNALNDQGGK